MKHRTYKTDQIRHIDELDERLSRLLNEVCFIANLSDMQPPQLLEFDSRELTALFENFRDAIKSAQSVVRKL